MWEANWGTGTDGTYISCSFLSGSLRSIMKNGNWVLEYEEFAEVESEGFRDFLHSVFPKVLVRELVFEFRLLIEQYFFHRSYESF